MISFVVHRRRLAAILAVAVLAALALIIGTSSSPLLSGQPAVPPSASSSLPQTSGPAAKSEMASSSAPTSPPLVPGRLSVIGPSAAAHVEDPVSLVASVRTIDGEPVPDVLVTGSVLGVNASAAISCVPVTCRTEDNGVLTVRYSGTATGSDTVTLSVVGAGLSQSEAVSWRPSVRGSAVALLGDSFSSGEGTHEYLSGTDVAGANNCHRSADAYGPLLVGVGTGVAFRACSGASTADLFAANGSGNKSSDGQLEPAQLCSGDCPDTTLAAVGADTRSVVLTIGGNDAGFTSVLASCLWISEFHLNYGRPGRGCRNSADLNTAITQRLSGLAGAAANTVGPNGRAIFSYNTILARIHSLAPNAQVYLVGYPRLFQPGSGDCYLGRVDVTYSGGHVSVAMKITPDDARWLDDKADALNQLEQQAAPAAGAWAHFVDPASSFAGHGVCGSDSWINGVSGSLTIHSTNDVDAAIDSGSFHPNVAGQKGLAAALTATGFRAGT